MNSIPFINRSIYKFQSMMTFDSYLTFVMHFFAIYSLLCKMIKAHNKIKKFFDFQTIGNKSKQNGPSLESYSHLNDFEISWSLRPLDLGIYQGFINHFRKIFKIIHQSIKMTYPYVLHLNHPYEQVVQNNSKILIFWFCEFEDFG